MYLLLMKRYSPESGTSYYDEVERINTEEVANLIFYKYSKLSDYCMIKVGFLTSEYIDTFFGEYDEELAIK